MPQLIDTINLVIQIWNNLQKRIDLWIVIPVLALAIFGIAMVSDASQYYGPLKYMIMQTIWVLLGIFIFIFVNFFIGIRFIRSMSKIIAVVVLGMLLAAYAWGYVSGTGARGWLFGLFQPAEFAKLAVIIYFADYFARREKRVNPYNIKKYWKLDTGSFLGLAFGLGVVLMYPDFGNFMIISLIFLFVWLAAGTFKTIWARLGFVFGVLFLIALPKIASLIPSTVGNYQIRRLITFANPWTGSDDSLQVVNSLLAIAHGGFFGTGGFGTSLVKPYMSVTNTDFIMAIAAEEFGWIIMIIILAVYFIFVTRILIKAIQATTIFNRVMLAGIGMYFAIQALINIGGVTSSLPLTGVTFPFISYGGTSILVSFAAIAIANKISVAESKGRKKK